MMQWFWYWLACWLQKRREDRVAISDHMADRVLASADPDYARALGILPPMPVVNNYNLMVGLFNDPTNRHIAQMLQQARQGFDPDYVHQAREADPFLQMLKLNMRQQERQLGLLRAMGGGLGSILGGPAGGALGAGLSEMLGGKEKH